ncbi:DUF2795 domain-containing protein [Melittangium boletus]|uniref:DUF2795 domain-containing protein n=1 Tax=Melittangium boletus DSM 14713 TaxID=1294270 RepID=A0A250I8C6_9BACT|nr:DUF2795 domain-containing protein [Melittangium boletus]ATB27458.1 hypothetical protein MEBOL_000900 [Melittangium boletus DSM 14713]
MAFGQAEDPALSITPHLEAVEYPTTRELLVEAAEDSGAPVDIINVFKSLPQEQYPSRRDVMRDLAEAARRFASGGLRDDDGVDRDRRNIGRDLVESELGDNRGHP